MNTYWYMFDDADIESIQRSGGLLPANMLANVQATYQSRSSTGAKYFEDTYNQHYREVVGEPYKHYGIYTTPIDLPPGSAKLRIRFPLTTLRKAVVDLRYGKLVRGKWLLIMKSNHSC